MRELATCLSATDNPKESNNFCTQSTPVSPYTFSELDTRPSRIDVTLSQDMCARKYMINEPPHFLREHTPASATVVFFRAGMQQPFTNKRHFLRMALSEMQIKWMRRSEGI